MAYDLMIGRSLELKDNPQYILGLEFDDQVKVLSNIQKRFNSEYIGLFCNPFEDVLINDSRLKECKREFLEVLIHPELKLNEKKLLCQLISVVVLAIEKDLPLYGVAD